MTFRTGLGNLGWLVAVLAGCATNRPQAAGPLFFPAPPDTARIQFLTRFSGSSDFKGGGPSWLDRLVGTETPQQQIHKPYGLGARRDWLYVCDIRLPGLVIVQLREWKLRQFQPRDAALVTPAACVPDPADGRLFVADAGAGRVLVFDSTLKFVTAFAGGDSAKPADVVVAGDRVWVSDLGLRTVRAYDRRTYDLILQFPRGEPNTPAFLAQPTHLAVAGDQVYVSDGLAFTVKVFDTAGRYLRSVGAQGRGPGQFVRPKGIAVDRSGYLYVVDAAFQNVQLFDSTGRLLTFFGGAYRGPGYLYAPVKVVVDYDNVEYFQRYVDPRFVLRHLIYVTNQFGPDKVTVYGFVEPKGGPIAAP